MRANELPRVEVEWVDAQLDPQASADLGDPRTAFGTLPVVQDVGYLYRMDRKELVLAISRWPDGNEINHSNTIPMDLVRTVTYLEATKCLTKLQLLKTLKSPRKIPRPGSG